MRSDSAHDVHMSEQDKALQQALSAAHHLAQELTMRWAGETLRPEVTAELTIGGDDQPLFVLSIDVDLADDLALDEYPVDEFQRLATELRGRVATTTVDDWSWLVDVGTKARRTHA